MARRARTARPARAPRHRTARVRGRRHAHRGHARGRYGNPADLQAMVKRQLDPARAAWQKPAAVVRALGLRPGQVVVEIGPGPGFFTPRLARAVGPRGRVYAVDPEPAMLEHLRERLAARRLTNVTPVLGAPGDPLLPDSLADVVLIVNAYHHFDDGPAYLRRAARLLRRGGRLVNIDWDRRETPVGPPLERRIARDRFLADAARAGLALAAEHRFLPYQYCLVLRRRG